MTVPAFRFERWSGPIALTVIVVLSAVALRTGRPPAPVPSMAPDTVFSSERAMDHVRAIADVRHPVGTVAHERALEYVVASLRSLGLEPHVQEATAVAWFFGRLRAAGVRNVVARIPGTHSTGAVALVSHYDSPVLAPGAADAASGVAAILEAVRALRAGPPLANDVIVLITDAEELGLLGAEAFVAEHPWAQDVALVLNFEARGSGGASIMFETGPRNGGLLRAYAARAPHPVASSLSYEIYRRMPNDTDFTVFRRAGIVGLNFAFVDDAHTYHQSFDTPENLSEASLQHHGEHALTLTRYFGSVDLTATSGADAIWFNVPGLGLVVYPMSWAIPLAVLVAGLWIGLLVWGLRSRRLTARDAFGGLLVAPVGLALAWAAAHLLMRHVYPLHAEHDLLQGRSQYVEGWYLLAVVALTYVPVAGLWLLARRWVGGAGAVLGALAVPAGLALFTAIAAPGASMVLLWPTLCALASVSYLLGRKEPPSADVQPLVVLGALAIPTLVILVPLLYLMFVAMNIELAPYLAVIAGLILVLLFPLIDMVRRPNRWWSLAAAAALCIAFLAAGILSRGFSSARPAPTSLVYALDGDADVAFWATGMETNDEWIGQVIPENAEPQRLERFFPGARTDFRTAEAPLLDLAAPTIETLSDTIADGTRHLTLAVRSGIGAPYLRLRVEQPQVRLLAVNRRAVVDSGHPGGFDFEYVGPAGEELLVELATATPGETIALELLEHRFELPVVEGLARERPATMFPVVRHWSDRTIVRRSFVVGG